MSAKTAGLASVITSSSASASSASAISTSRAEIGVVTADLVADLTAADLVADLTAADLIADLTADLVAEYFAVDSANGTVGDFAAVARVLSPGVCFLGAVRAVSGVFARGRASDSGVAPSMTSAKGFEAFWCTWRSRVSVSFAGFTGSLKAPFASAPAAEAAPARAFSFSALARSAAASSAARRANLLDVGLDWSATGVARPLVAALSNHASTSWSTSSPASKSWKCGAQNSHLSPRGWGRGSTWGRGGRGSAEGAGAGRDGTPGGIGNRGDAASREWAARLRAPLFHLERHGGRVAAGTPRGAVAATTLCCVSIGRRARRPTRRDARAADTPERAPSRDRATPRRATSACRRGRRARACAPPPRLGLARVFNFDVFKFKCPACRGERWNRRPTVCRGFKIPDRSEEAFFFSG